MNTIEEIKKRFEWSKNYIWSCPPAILKEEGVNNERNKKKA